MDRKKLQKDIEAMARKHGVKLYDVPVEYPDGSKTSIKVVKHGYEMIISIHKKDFPGGTYKIPKELLSPKND